MILDNRLDFKDHIQLMLSKVSRPIALIRKLRLFLPRSALLTIYKSYIRPHFDYGDIIYDQAFKNTFHQNLESLQYNAALAITGAIKCSRKQKVYQLLGLEYLQERRWFRRMSVFFKIFRNQSPKYLFQSI